MGKTNVSKIIKSVKTSVSKHSPEILTCLGITGMISSTVLAVKSTPKALEIIEYSKEEKGEDLTAIETVQKTWKCYIPSAVTCTASIACLIGATKISSKRHAALVTAYTLSEKAMKEYKDKVIDTIGEKKEKNIREKVNQQKIDDNKVSNNEVIITNKGDTLCYDGVSGRYFKSDIDKIKRAINEVNRTMTYDNYVSLSDFYDEIGLEHTNVSDYLGWNLDDGLIEVCFDARISEDGTPCIVLDYLVAPRYEFDKFI